MGPVFPGSFNMAVLKVEMGAVRDSRQETKERCREGSRTVSCMSRQITHNGCDLRQDEC